MSSLEAILNITLSYCYTSNMFRYFPLTGRFSFLLISRRHTWFLSIQAFLQWTRLHGQPPPQQGRQWQRERSPQVGRGHHAALDEKTKAAGPKSGRDVNFQGTAETAQQRQQRLAPRLSHPRSWSGHCFGVEDPAVSVGFAFILVERPIVVWALTSSHW